MFDKDKCPNCGGRVLGGEYEITSEHIIETLTCIDCGAEWCIKK